MIDIMDDDNLTVRRNNGVIFERDENVTQDVTQTK